MYRPRSFDFNAIIVGLGQCSVLSYLKVMTSYAGLCALCRDATENLSDFVSTDLSKMTLYVGYHQVKRAVSERRQDCFS